MEAGGRRLTRYPDRSPQQRGRDRVRSGRLMASFVSADWVRERLGATGFVVIDPRSAMRYLMVHLFGGVVLMAGITAHLAGGGGLLTLPALLLAGLNPVNALATNKLQGTFGSGMCSL
mgnify:CR=1 FL=1